MNESEFNFRCLRADEIEIRFDGSAYPLPSGLFAARILLYKNARVDMTILDETVGPERWQNDFVNVGGKLVCRLGIKTVAGEWIWKSDCGIEGSIGEDKSQASDARKRAGFAWGIGRELYTTKNFSGMRELYINLNQNEVHVDANSQARGLQPEYRVNRGLRLSVGGIFCDEKKHTIEGLLILDQNGLIRYQSPRYKELYDAAVAKQKQKEANKN